MKPPSSAAGVRGAGAWRAGPDRHSVIAVQLHRLRATITAQDFDPHEHGQLSAAAEHVEQALAGRWPTDSTTG